jgi:serine/threonine protein kinase
MSEDKKYERFGKYLVLDHLVDGGMAKISRARFLGEQANKLMAIKMVQAQFSKDPEFVRMFEDELKVCFGLQHPNIAQTYDYGMVGDQLYTAMELIEGANLKEYLDRLAEKKYVFPVQISVYIITQVCQGLQYAHNYKDPLTNKPLNIIHRDISPHNVMLSYDGAVKVIDFGIAKAESNSEATQAGTIKGKLAYLAPEYLDGLTLDPRYDEFAVGITLWELLCSRRLFTANNDLAVLKKIQQCKIPPPSSINPNVPKELDQIVLKALDKDRTLRYGSPDQNCMDAMDQFNRALTKFLYATYPDFNPTDLKHFGHELFKEEIAEQEKQYEQYGKIDIRPYIEDYQRAQAGGGDGGAAPSGDGAPAIKGPQVRELEFDADALGGLTIHGDDGSDEAKANREKEAPKSKRQKAADRTQTRRINRRALKGGAGTSSSIRNPNLRKSGTRTSIKRAQLEQTQSSGGSGGKMGLMVVAGLAAFIYFKADMIENMTGLDLSFITGKKQEVVQQNRQHASVAAQNTGGAAPVANSQRSGVLYLENIDDPYLEVFIDNKRVTMAEGGVNVPVGKQVVVRVEKPGYLAYEKAVRLTPQNLESTIVVPQLQVARVGLLSTSQNYDGSKMIIMINGKEVEKPLPANNMRIPAGKYEAVIVNELLGTEKEVEFEINENKRTYLE